MSVYRRFTDALLQWYSQHQRDLPWRHTRDPYAIWVSEIMLQQTQVSRVAASYYPNFLEKFPTVQSLAAASWDTVYPYWKGLGYYQRGKNLLKAAKMVCDQFDGQVPLERDLLRLLPGIGDYTSAAIISFATDARLPAIDTNISRLIRGLWPRRSVSKVAYGLIRQARSGRDWNSAMMDLATHLRTHRSVEGGLAEFFPPKVVQRIYPPRPKPKPKPKRKYTRKIEVGVACIYEHGRYLIQTRPEGKTFTGRWEFPGGKREKGEDFRACVKREIMEEIGVEVSVRPHFYEEICHFGATQLVLRFHRCQIQAGTPQPLEGQELDWVPPSQFGSVHFLDTNRNALARLQQMRV